MSSALLDPECLTQATETCADLEPPLYSLETWTTVRCVKLKS